MANESEGQPKEVVQSVLREFLNMNKCAIVYTEFRDFLATFKDEEQTFSLAYLKQILATFEARADERLALMKKVVES